MFELFTNKLPFEVVGNIHQAVAMQNTWLELHRKGPDWTKLKATSDAKDFCKQCLTFKERERPSAIDCLKHQWFTSSGCNDLTQEEIDSLCKSVALWRDRSPMQRALCLKMAVGCTCISKFARLFSKFDADCSGVLERSEVVAALMSLGIDKATARKTAAALDINNDNSCEYLEFVAACLSSLENQFDELLQQEFRILDKGRKGELREKELAQLIAELTPIAESHGLKLEDIDANGDGNIGLI
jgi:Ca2+-binding EF-hand superfamily protein